MITLLSTVYHWIYAKLEYVLGAGLGLSSMAIDIPQTILKLLLAVVLGFLGGFGGWCWKLLASKLQKSKLKNDKIR